jgi:hypothetical protein
VTSVRDADSFSVIEPRIPHLKREIERLLSTVRLTRNGHPVEVDGFRLRNLEDWTDSGADNALNALVPISGLCNSRCAFCFESNLPFARERSLMGVEEARTRLKHYDPATGVALFPSNRPHMEPFLHPQALEIVEMARKRQPDTLFWLTTNGSHLDEPTIARLAKLHPLMLKLSINVVDPVLNLQLMRTQTRTAISIAAPPLLRQYRIPFIGSIVAWPTLPLDALEETARYLSEHRAYAIRIRLPLTHKWLSEPMEDVDFSAHWDAIVEFARHLRAHLDVPLFVEPPVYWITPIVPEVDGVVLNSPAWRAGVQVGDIIRSINGAPVATRADSEVMLARARVVGSPMTIEIERNKQRLSLTLDAAYDGADYYPYDPRYFYRGESFGIFHVEDFRVEYACRVLDMIEQYDAANTLLFSSPVVADIFDTLLADVPWLAQRLGTRVIYIDSIRAPLPGGNFAELDSRFVDDYLTAARRHIAAGRQPDLILVPDVSADLGESI